MDNRAGLGPGMRPDYPSDPIIWLPILLRWKGVTDPTSSLPLANPCLRYLLTSIDTGELSPIQVVSTRAVAEMTFGHTSLGF